MIDTLKWKCHSFTHSFTREQRCCQRRVPSFLLSCFTLCRCCHFFFFFFWCRNLPPSVSHSTPPVTTLAPYSLAASQSLLTIFHYPWTPAPPTSKSPAPTCSLPPFLPVFHRFNRMHLGHTSILCSSDHLGAKLRSNYRPGK